MRLLNQLNRSRRSAVSLSVFCLSLFSSALAVPALIVPPLIPRSTVYVTVNGYQCLTVYTAPWWWSNPLFALGLIFLATGHRRPAFICGVLASTLATTLIILVPGFLDTWTAGWTRAEGFGFPLRPGYFLWIGSMIALTWFARPQTKKVSGTFSTL